ncbi:MAG: glycosyltransferase family 4 protein [Gemmatimonas sp.]
MTLQIVLMAILSFGVATVLTRLFRNYALKGGLLDVPNERSSHDQPTPRGGGVAIVLATLASLPMLALLHVIDWRMSYGLMAAGSLAAGVGYADDRATVPLWFRLLFQFAAAAMVVLFIGAETLGVAIPVLAGVPWLCSTLAVGYLVWMLNLTNFMDGIDGIASVEAITICLGAVLCLLLAPRAHSANNDALAVGVELAHRNGAIAFALTLAAATTGFLRWNWPPARIFMGDAGSGFLGVLLGALTLVAGTVSPSLLWSCVILGGVFVVDATTTLFRRIARREKFYHAHRSHAYQHAAQCYGHARVTTTVAALNVCWCLPWALLAARGTLHGAVALALAYIPLLAVALRFRAGLPD